MVRVVLFVGFLAIVSSSAAVSIESVDPSENLIEARALYTGQGSALNGLVLRVKCVTDTIDAIVAEYRAQGLWQDVQTKLHGNINNLLSCLKYSGFAAQGCVAREVIGLGLQLNGFLSKIDSETPEGGKQMRLRLATNCSNRC